MAFLDTFFHWMDSKVERINSRDMSEKVIEIQERTKDKLSPLLTRDTPDRKTRKELSKANNNLKKALLSNKSNQEWAENERSNQLDINDYERQAEVKMHSSKDRQVFNNIYKSLIALHQKFLSMKATTITDNDTKDVNKLFSNIQINIGTLPTIKPYSDDFARMIISINDVVKSQGVNAGTIDVLIDLSNGALTKFNVLKSRI